MSGSSDSDLTLEYYKSIFESSLNAILLTHLDSTIFYANSAAEELFGYTQKELCDLGRKGIVDAKDPNLPVMLEERASTGKTRGELTFIKKDRSKFTAEVSSSIFKDKNGILNTFMIISDKTENKKAKRELHESEEKYHSLYTSMNEGVALHKILYNQAGKAVDYVIMDVNPSYEEILGLKRNDVIDRKASEIYGTDNPPYLNIYSLVAETGNSETFETYFEPMDRYFSISVFSPRRGEFATIFEDISERKRAEEKVKQSEASFRSVLQNSLDVVYRFNLQTGCYEYMSPAIRGLGFEPEELMAMSDDEVISRVHPDDRPALLTFLSHINETGKGLAEYRFRGNDDTYRWWSNQMVIINDSGGKPLYRDGSVRDITEPKKAEKALQDSIKREKFLSDLLDNSAQPFGVGYPDGSLGLINRAFEELTGYSMEELKRIDWMQALTPHKFRDMEQEKLEELQRTGQPVRYEKEYIRKDGTRVPIELLVHLVRNEDGTPYYYYSFITDITERQENENERKDLLKEAQRVRDELSTLIENIVDEVWFCDSNGNILLANAAARKFEQNVDQKSINSIDGLISSVKIYDSDGKPRPKEGSPLLRALNGEILTDMEEMVIFQNLGKKQYRQVTSTPIRNANKEIIGAVAVVRDITERKEAEEALRESEERLRLAQTRGNVGVWDWNTVTDELNFTPELEHLYGLSPGTIKTYHDWRQLTHPDDIEKIEAERDDKIAKHEPFDLEFRIFHKSGDVHWLSARGGAMYNEEGDVVRVLGINTDITDRKQAEEEILMHGKLINGINKLFSESLTCETEEEVANKCLEVAEELTGSEFGFIAEMKANGRVDDIALSPPAWEVCKAPPKKAHELIKDMSVVSYWGRVINEGKSQIVNDPDSDPDRRGVPKGHPKITSFIGVPLKQAGKTIGMIALANKEDGYDEEDKENIEALSVAFVEALFRKRAEIQLNDTLVNLEGLIEERTYDLSLANQYNRNLIETSLDPLVTIGPKGKITDVNRATEKVTGYSREELIGTDFVEYFTIPEEAKTGYQQVFREGTVRNYPLEIKHKNGSLTPVLYNASVYKDESGEVIGVFAAARDITERKKAEDAFRVYWESLEEQVEQRTEELAKSNADLKQFAYVASHDLREPLRMISSFLQLLERRYQDQLDQDANEFIGYAVDGAKRLDKMIMDLLEYSRVANKEIQFTDVDLEKVIDQIKSNLNVLIRENNAQITYDSLPIIQSDENQMVILLQNLISNAIKYRRAGKPQIHISAEKEANQYVFSVKDNGIGIDPKHLERIFTIFQRLHNHTEYEGTGIGLSITQRIVHQHGGEIWAESQPGKGSTFYFTIPNMT
jgi:PAS domain S-box-containing protein